MSKSTSSTRYTERLLRLEGAWWKQLIPVQAPYRYNLRRLVPGFMLEIGCGIGRNLRHIDGHAVGVDHNADSVRLAQAQGFKAFTSEEFQKSSYAKEQGFDSLLFSHVLEHMTYKESQNLVLEHLKYLRKGGKLILICPQEAGYQSDETHVEYMDRDKLKSLVKALGLEVAQAYSFPFPRFVGRLFPYNEHVVVGVK